MLAFAYLFLLLLGLVIQRTHRPGPWSATNSTRRPQASLFFIARVMQDKVRCPVGRLLQAFRDAIEQQTEQDWG